MNAYTAVALTVNGVPVAISGGYYSTQVGLEEGSNTIIVSMTDTEGMVSTASVHVSLDLTPPYITIESHTDTQVVHSQPIAVTGLINDIVRGTVEEAQANVTVNGVVASISNRSYLAENIPLVPGDNVISVAGTDAVGNTAQTSIVINYQILAGHHLSLISGQDQTAGVGEELASPLIVQVMDDNNQGVADKNVVFRVIQGSGILDMGSSQEGRGVLVQTDANGFAQSTFELGQRSGTGNHKVRARVVGYDDEIVFYASATPNIGNKLSVNSGNNQRGGIHQPLPAPFIVAVTDEGTNVVAGSWVEFEVNQGGGHFQNDQETYEVQTDSDGRASAHLTLGGVTGLDRQTITATLIDAPTGQTITAGFSATGFIPGDPGNTTISGVVFDNQDDPLEGVTVRVDGTTRQAVSDASGIFSIEQAPVGPVHLIVDGSTTTAEGEFPTLSYNLVTVSGVDNPLAAPIYMVKLNTDNAVYAGLEDVEITLPEVPGFKLEILAGSVTFPDGSNEGFISVTPVNASKVPMAPPNGMQPQFIVTIQPTGAVFDPPAPLTLPNVDGHAPGAQVEMFSYDHDLEEFVAIGLGTVSSDSTVIKTNPGVGVIKAGWHCGAQATNSGCCSGPEECDESDYCTEPVGLDVCDAGCRLIPDLVLKPEDQIRRNCRTETCGGSIPNDADKPIDTTEFFDCYISGCENGAEEPEYSPSDYYRNFCRECTPDGERPLPDKTKCDDGTRDKKGDCKIPGCNEGHCYAKMNVALFDKPDDLDVYDCFIPDCDEFGVTETWRREPFFDQNSKCVFCSSSGPVDRCYEIYGEKLTELFSGLRFWMDENCGEPIPPLPGITIGGVAADVILMGVDKALCTKITVQQLIIDETNARFRRENCYATCQLY